MTSDNRRLSAGAEADYLSQWVWDPLAAKAALRPCRAPLMGSALASTMGGKLRQVVHRRLFAQRLKRRRPSNLTAAKNGPAARGHFTRCSGSRARVQPRNFFPHTPPSTIPSTSDAISSQPKRTARFALRR